MKKKMLVIGLPHSGLDSLSPENLQAIQDASLLVGGERLLSFVKKGKAERLALKANYKEAVERIKAELDKGGKPVMLASGDPLFYGIAKLLISKLGAEKVEVRPWLSSMQVAFARAGLSWEDAALLSVHGRPIENLIEARRRLKVGIFTDPENTPARCAAFLIDMGWPKDAEAWVCENLEGEDEKVWSCSLGELKKKKAGDLNVLLVARESIPDLSEARAFGLADESFVQRKPEKGLITRAEVRVLSLSKMRVFPGSVVWDIGAATASVSIEAARLGARRVWAVEKNEEDCANARENVEKFHTPQVKVLHGKAPEILNEIPKEDAPDAVFVGGSAGRLGDILNACQAKLNPGGSLVMNMVTLENQAEALEWLRKSGLEFGALQVQVSRLKPILDLHRLDALNPVMLLWGYKAK